VPSFPPQGTITAQILIKVLCPGHACGSFVNTTASAVTPDPNPANNAADGTWRAVCNIRGNCGA
jgi:hypothetical protein